PRSQSLGCNHLRIQVLPFSWSPFLEYTSRLRPGCLFPASLRLRNRFFQSGLLLRSFPRGCLLASEHLSDSLVDWPPLLHDGFLQLSVVLLSFLFSGHRRSLPPTYPCFQSSRRLG